ncbi:MAG: polysaccharide deacetylase family protein, partial [Victivallales bacterium]|nr:polysaccharide deacetylase family protein [Victivallales bacterium]MBT7302307.1 polysaccharide deacetylase family protein [Victivallales bacterium]
SVEICRWRNDAPFAYSMTYDEGTVDALANALPVHEQFGFPGHVDVVAGQLGQQRHALGSSMNGFVHMSADELKFLIGKGWGVGNHSWSHYSYPCQPGLDLYREVVWSKCRLEDMIDHPVRVFTIPNDTHNYEPVIDLVKQHYLACAYVEGGPNREGFDLYQIGNCVVASDGFRPRPGWPREMKTEDLTLDFVTESWVYETSHLCMWNVPQAHKCLTPEYLTRRFEKLTDISGGKLWAAKPDDVIDYVLVRRNLSIGNVRTSDDGVAFDGAVAARRDSHPHLAWHGDGEAQRGRPIGPLACAVHADRADPAGTLESRPQTTRLRLCRHQRRLSGAAHRNGRGAHPIARASRVYDHASTGSLWPGRSPNRRRAGGRREDDVHAERRGVDFPLRAGRVQLRREGRTAVMRAGPNAGRTGASANAGRRYWWSASHRANPTY